MPTKEEKIPLSQVKKLPYKSLNRMLKKMREFLKKNEVVQQMFKDYGADLEEIDYIPMMFGNLDVSAKTDHGVIIYNYRLLTDGDFFKDFSYGVHEMTHWLQQTTGNKATKSSDDGDYLHNKYEQEGFSNQVEYIADQFGKDEAEQYVDDLLEHHEVEDKKEKNELKEVLMSKAFPERTPEQKERIKNIKHLLLKYHPDKPTGDVEKYMVLVQELQELQNGDETKPTEPIKVIVPTKMPPWGDWYQPKKISII